MAKIALREYSDCRVIFIRTGSEHPDSFRFLSDIKKWLGVSIEVYESPTFQNHWDVIAKTRYLNGAAGARCTLELKKKVRYKIEDSIGYWEHQLFGFDASELTRSKRFAEQNPSCRAVYPLIDYGLTKEDCMAILGDAGIAIPEMYKLGFHNNNCIGCVKGGKSYWSLVRKCFPDAYHHMVQLESSIGHSCIKDFFLKDLPLDYPIDSPICPSCNLWCDLDFFHLPMWDTY